MKILLISTFNRPISIVWLLTFISLRDLCSVRRHRYSDLNGMNANGKITSLLLADLHYWQTSSTATDLTPDLWHRSAPSRGI